MTRNQSSEDILFLRLFDELDKQKGYDEGIILKKIEGIKKRQLSNLKAHLYKQLLLCLRLLQRGQNVDIEVRERIDYARVLYNKGLYKQSLEILDKAKTKARHFKQFNLTLDIIEFEKHIESQYITRSIESRAEELTSEAKQITGHVSRAHIFSNLSLQLYSLYLKVGYIKNSKDYFFVREFFVSNLPKYQLEELDFYERLHLYQAHCWFFSITQDFLNYYKYAQKWVDLFHKDEQMIEVEPSLYLKGLHNLLNALYMLWHYDKFIIVLGELEAFAEKFKPKPSTNLDSLLFLFQSLHRINKHYIEGTFTEGLQLVPELERKIRRKHYNWDFHREMVFYYRIACLYFGSGDNKNAIKYLNKIINQPSSEIRGDIQCFARILNLIAHFELGNEILVEYQIKSVYRFLIKMEDLHAVQKEILKFLRKLPNVHGKQELKVAFERLKVRLIRIQAEPYERRPFLYLDIISWLESKIEGRLVQDVIREKFGKREKPLLG